MRVEIKESHLHPHLKSRMRQRGISLEEMEIVINSGWDASDAKRGTIGKVFVFPYNEHWEGKYFEEKEVTIYFKQKGMELIVLTAKARYGKAFPKRKE